MISRFWRGSGRRTARSGRVTRRRSRMSAERLEPRAMLAVVLPNGTQGPPGFWDLGGAPLAITTDSAVGTNGVEIEIFSKTGTTYAKVTTSIPAATKTYFGFNSAISFTGKATDPLNLENNQIKLTVPYEIAASGSGTVWNLTADLSPVPLPNVGITLNAADSLEVEACNSAPSGVSTIQGTFTTPGSIVNGISLKAQGTINVAGPLSVKDLTLGGLASTASATVTFNGPVTAAGNLNINTNVDGMTVNHPLMAGGQLNLDVNVNKGPPPSLTISAPLSANSLSLKSNDFLTVNAPLTGTGAGSTATLNAGTVLTVNDDITFDGAIDLDGNSGVVLAATCDLKSTIAGITIDSNSAGITAAGSATAGTSIAIKANTAITSSAILVAKTDDVTLTSTTGSITSSGTVTAVAKAVTMTANLGITTSAKIAATTAATLTSTLGSILVDAPIQARDFLGGAGSVVTLTAGQDITTTARGPIDADQSVLITAGGGVDVGAALTVWGFAPAAGTIDILGKTQPVVVRPSSPITVADGKVEIEAAAGKLTVDSLVSATTTLDLKANQGVTLSNAVDLGAKLVAAGPASKITITNSANRITLDAPISATGAAPGGAVSVTNAGGRIDVLDDILADDALDITANLALNVGGKSAPITLQSSRATIDLTSTTSTVALTSNLALVLPGVASGLNVSAGTLATIAIPVTAGGAIAITSPQGFTVAQPLTALNDGITITAANGGVSSTSTALTAKGDITLTGDSAAGVTVGTSVSSTAGGIELASKAGPVTIQPGTVFLAPSVVAGDIVINSGATPVIGIDLVAGKDISVTGGNGPVFAPTKNFTALGSVTITTPGGNLNVTGSTITAGLDVSLSAPAGQLILNMGTINVGRNLTLIDFLGFMPVAPMPLVVPGDITIQSGGGWVALPGQDVKSLAGDIAIKMTGGTLDVSAVTIDASLGSIELESTVGDVIVKTLLVDPTTGSITLTAAGQVIMQAALLAGDSITLTSASVLGMNLRFPLTAVTGDLIATSVGDLAIGADLTAGSKLQLAATGPTNIIKDLGTGSSVIPFVMTATDMSATFPGIGGLDFVNPLNDVDTLSIILPSGTGISFVDVDDITVTGLVTNGPVSLDALTGFLTVTGAIGASPPTVTTVDLKAAADIAVEGAINAINTVTATSAGGDVIVSGSILSTTDAVTLTAGGNVKGVDVGGTILATKQVTAAAPVGPISITGSITSTTEGVGIAAAGAITLGGTGTKIVAGGTTGLVSRDVVVTSGAGTIKSGADISAVLGSITMTTPNTLEFSGGSLVAALTYSALPPPVGLVSLQGAAGIDVLTNPVIKAGRLELGTGGGGAVTLTSPLNDIRTLEADVGGNFTYSQVLGPLSINDPDSGGVRSVQVRSAGGSVTISSAAGLRIVDGLEYATTLSLTGLTTGPAPGVVFVPTDAGDNPSPPNPPPPFAFAGTLRDMLTYVNDNTSVTGARPGTVNTPMTVLFDEPNAPVGILGTITLGGPAPLPFIAKSITFDGTLPAAPFGVGGVVGINGVGVVGNGLTLDAGSAGSTIRNAAIHGFTIGSGVQLLSSDNRLHDLKIGLDRNGMAAGNEIGIDVFGKAADRNVIGVTTAGSGQAGNVIGNNLSYGIHVWSGADYTRIQGNAIGVDFGGNAMPNAGDGIAVEGSLGTVIGSDVVGLGNRIANSGVNGIMVQDVSGNLTSYGVQIMGNTIAANAATGIKIAGGSRNLVGGSTLTAGNTITGNVDGIRLVPAVVLTSPNANDNLVIGNTVSGNRDHGIRIRKGHSNRVTGNTVSTNGISGISLVETVATTRQPANRVVGNTVTGNGDGIVVDKSSGQVIGLTRAGAILGNDATINVGSGILVTDSTSRGNMIVGNTAAGNLAAGIRVKSALATLVQGNRAAGNVGAGIAVEDVIATRAADGTAVVANSVSANAIGVLVSGGQFNRIGGTIDADRNLVNGNVGAGIRVEASAATGMRASGTVIRRNLVGTDAGNGGFGIVVDGAIDTTIDHANLIANNTAGGISVSGTEGGATTIGSAVQGRGNTILQNGGVGVLVTEPPAPSTKLTTNVTVIGNLIEGNAGYGVSCVGPRTQGVVIGRHPSVSRPNGTENTIRGNGSGSDANKLGVLVNGARNVTVIGNNIRVAAGGVPLTVVPATPYSVTALSWTPSAPAKIPQIDIRGTVTGTPNTSFYVDLYSVNTNDDRLWVGRVLVRTRADGSGGFRLIVRGTFAGLGLTATATPAPGFSLIGGTSEFYPVVY